MQELERFREAWVSACLAFDEPAADRVLKQALAAFPPEVICLEVLRDGLSQIGEAWYQGKATVHQEHFASHLAVHQVQALLANTPFPAFSDPVMIACPPGEYHTFGVLLLTYLLRRDGWKVVYLGADLPVKEAEAAVRRAAPRWVIVGAYHLPPVVGIRGLGCLLRDMGVPLAYGGRIFNLVPALCSRISGHFLGRQLPEALGRLKEWADAPPPPPAITPEDEAVCRTRSLFLEREWDIRARVLRHLSLHPFASDLPEWLVNYTFSHIRAALILGDVSFADAYAKWLWGLRNGLSLPEGWVGLFLEAFRKSVEHHMGGEGALLVEWLARQAVRPRAVPDRGVGAQ